MALEEKDHDFLKEWVVEPINEKISGLTDEFKKHVENHNEDVNKINVTLEQWKGALKLTAVVIIPIVLMWLGSIIIK